MPDDLQALVNELAPKEEEQDLQTQSTQDPTNEEGGQDDGAQTKAQDADTDSKEGEGGNTDDSKEDPETLETELEKDKANRAFAEMRAQNSKYNKVFKKLQDVYKVENEEAVIEKLLQGALDAEAKSQNIDPALLKRLQEIEETNQSLMYEKQETVLRQKFEALQADEKLTDEQMINFAKELVASEIDITRNNVDLKKLYRGFYYDTLTKKQIEAEKQNWIKGQKEADAAPTVTGTKGRKTDPESKTIETEADLSAVLNSFN